MRIETLRVGDEESCIRTEALIIGHIATADTRIFFIAQCLESADNLAKRDIRRKEDL
jgi:hypothetical protein